MLAIVPYYAATLCFIPFSLLTLSAGVNGIFNRLSYSELSEAVIEDDVYRPYEVKPSYGIRCSFGQIKENDLITDQHSLLFEDDSSTLSCQVFNTKTPADTNVIPDISGVDSTYSPRMNVFLKASFQNGTRYLEKSFEDSTFNTTGLFTLKLNRFSLGNSKDSAALPWEVRVSAGVQPLTRDKQLYATNTFTILDSTSQQYLHWEFGTKMIIPPTSAITQAVNDPCTPQIVMLVSPGTDGHVYIGRSKSLRNIGDYEWFDTVLPEINCQIKKVTALVRHFVLHTGCGAYVSNDLTEMSKGKNATFAKNSFVPTLETNQFFANTKHCSLKRDTDVLPPADTFFYKNTAGAATLSMEPFNQNSTLSPLANYPDSDNFPNSKYRSFFASAIKDNTNIVATYRSSKTKVYFLLVKSVSADDKWSYTVFSQGFDDLVSNRRSTRPVLVVAKSINFKPKRFLANPVTGDIFLIGSHVFLLMSNGGSFKEIFDVKQAAAPSLEEVTDILFGPSGLLIFLIAKEETGQKYSVLEGNAYNGPFDRYAANLDQSSDLVVDATGKLRTVTVTGSVELTRIAQASLTVPGKYSILALTSKMYLLTEWSDDPVFTSKFSSSDISRNIKVGEVTGFVIGYLPGEKQIAASAGSWRMTGSLIVETFRALTTSLPVSANVAIATSVDSRKGTITPSDQIAVGATIVCEKVGDPHDVVREFWLVTAAGVAVSPHTRDEAGTLNLISSDCKKVDLSVPTTNAGTPGWKFEDESGCPMVYMVNQSAMGPLVVNTDRNDVLNFAVNLKPKESRSDGRAYFDFINRDIALDIASPWRLSVHTESNGNNFEGYDLSYTAEDVKSSFQVDNDVTSVNFRMGSTSLGCAKDASLGLIPLTVNSGCPRGSKTEYIYPDGRINDTVWKNPGSILNMMGDPVLGEIPLNYRPPSDSGPAFPTSPRIYNFDPSQPYPRNAGPDEKKYPVTLASCPDIAKKRGECKCSLSAEQSFDPKDSECLTKAVFLPHPGDHFFKFRSFKGYQDDGFLDGNTPLVVTEVNNRRDFVIGSPPNAETSSLGLLQSYYKDKKANLFNSNTTIRFLGTGLFHFEIKMMDLETYCNAVTNMVFFLYSPNLQFPIGQVCQCWMGLLVALWLFPALKSSGEQTLLDYRKHMATRPPDRVPLVDPDVDRAEWEDGDLEAEVNALEPKRSKVTDDEGEDVGEVHASHSKKRIY